MTPFQAVYGRPPPPLPCYSGINSGLPAVDQVLLDRSELIQQLKENLARARNRMKAQADKQRRDIEFSIRDLVLVKLQPYRQQSVVRRPFQKLCKRFFGPYKVLEKIGAVAYRLELPATSHIHPVFHVSLLKPWKGPLPPTINQLPERSVDDHPLLTPKEILGKCMIVHNGQTERQVLVQWYNSPEEDTSWESFSDIAALFPSLHLEDKVHFGGGNGDKDADKGMEPIELKGEVKDLNETVDMHEGAGERRQDVPTEEPRRVSVREKRESRWLRDYAR